MDVNTHLSNLLSENYVDKQEEIVKYSNDASYITGRTPIGVAFPVNSDQVCKIIDICRESGVSIVTRGGGSSLTGSSVPFEKSIVLSTVKMNKILEINTRDRYVAVQPGVILSDLNATLNKKGFFYPPDPASSAIATVGGTIATNAGGLRAIAYGTTKEWVLGLDVVLGNGRKIAVGGKVLKRTTGYDLTSLFVGSEGTLGIITMAYLKIIPVPEATGMIVSFFSSMAKLSSSIGDLKAKGVPLMIAEFLDDLALHSLSDAGLLDFPDTSKYMLMIVLQSTRESLKRHLNNAVKIINTSRPLSVEIVKDKKGMERYYEARRSIGKTLYNLRSSEEESAITLDIVVPTSQISKTLMAISSAARSYKIRCLLAGHIGDGNVHPALIVNLTSPEGNDKALKLMHEVGKIAVKNGGSVSAEHGIGLQKKHLLLYEMEFKNSSESIDIMRKIKEAIDPSAILNPGKIFD